MVCINASDLVGDMDLFTKIFYVITGWSISIRYPYRGRLRLSTFVVVAKFFERRKSPTKRGPNLHLVFALCLLLLRLLLLPLASFSAPLTSVREDGEATYLGARSLGPASPASFLFLSFSHFFSFWGRIGDRDRSASEGVEIIQFFRYLKAAWPTSYKFDNRVQL